AARARPALAVLTAELGEPSPDAARALVVLGQMLDVIEAGRHPLDRPDDWPHRDRWPDRPHWDRWRWALKTLAVARGSNAYCSPKYEYMRVDTRQARSDALTGALLDVADVIELASVREPSSTIDSFLGLCAGRTTPALTIEDMNKIAAAGCGWDPLHRSRTPMHTASGASARSTILRWACRAPWAGYSWWCGACAAANVPLAGTRRCPCAGCCIYRRCWPSLPGLCPIPCPTPA